MSSKILLYPAEMISTIESTNESEIDVQSHKIEYNKVMEELNLFMRQSEKCAPRCRKLFSYPGVYRS